MHPQHTEPTFANQHLYVALDVHKKSWKVSIVSEFLTHKTFTQPPKVEILVRYLRHHYPGAQYHVVYEAGFCGFWIHDALQTYGIACSVVNPADVPTTDKEKRHKTDAVDSQKLARSLRNGELRPLYVPPRRALEDRTLVRTRKGLVAKQTRCKNQIKGLLMFYGIDVPDDISDRYWSRRYIAWLTQLRMQSFSGDQALHLLLSELMQLRTNILAVTRNIHALAKEDPYATLVTLMITIPGISTLTAMIVLTELVAITRFKTLDALASFVGLVPGEHSSGEERITTGITQRKNPYLRWILIEASWVAVRHDPALAAAFTALSHRMPKNQAIIRVARKLLNRIRFVLKSHQPYVSRLAA